MTASQAIDKVEHLSPARAKTVFALIEDLTELEALEMQFDLKAARASLGEPGPNVTLESVAQELGQ